MMVLAVDVGRYGAAHRHHAGSGGHRHEQPERDQAFHQLVQARPGSGGHASSAEVDVGYAGVGRAAQYQAAGVLGTVAVAPTEPPRDQPAIGCHAQGSNVLPGGAG